MNCAPHVAQIAENTDDLIIAIKMRDVESFKMFLPISDPTLYDNAALRIAAEMGLIDFVVDLIPGSNLPQCLDQVLATVAENGHEDCLQYLTQYIDTPDVGHSALVRAAVHGQYACLNILLPFVNAQGHSSEAFTEALVRSVSRNNVECFKLLLPHSDPKADNSRALRVAAEHGHGHLVELLIPVSNPKACNSQALRFAAFHGFRQVVQLLIPVSNPKAKNSAALVAALDFDDKRLAEMLYDVSDLAAALRVLHKRHPNSSWPELEERLAAQQQKAILNEVVGLDNGSKRTRKM